MDNLITLPHPMYFRIRTLVVFIVTVLALPTIGMASVIFQPGKKAKYVVPGEEEISGNAAELFQIGQTAEREGNTKRAIKAYESLVKRHPRDTLAAGALFRAAELQEQSHDYLRAAESFRQLVEKYPGSPHFDEAIEGQFRIGEVYLAGKKLRSSASRLRPRSSAPWPFSRLSFGQLPTESTQRARNLILASSARSRVRMMRPLKRTRLWWTSSRTNQSQWMPNTRSVTSGSTPRKREQKTLQPLARPKLHSKISFFIILTARKRHKRALTSACLSKSKHPVPSK